MKSSANHPDAYRGKKRDAYGHMTKLELIAALRARDDERTLPQDALFRQAEDQRQQMELQNEQLSDAHAELEQSRHRYADLYDKAPVGYVTFDDKGCIREINYTAAELLGYSAAHLTGKPLIPYLAQPDRKVFLQHLWQCRHQDKEQIITLHLISKNGVERQVEFITRPGHDFENRPGWCRSAIVDVTDRRATESALSASEAKFRLLAENIGDVFWFMELDPPRVTYVSPAFEHIWGIPAADLYADHTRWEQAIHPDDLQAVETAFHSWVRGDTSFYRLHYRVIHRNGSIRWLADRGIVIGRKDGRPSQICGIARDITSRLEAEAARTRLVAVVESSEDAIITADLDGTIRTWNGGAESILGYTMEEAVGMPISILTPPELEKEARANLDRIRKGKHIDHFETRRRRKDGQLIDVSLCVSPLRDSTGRIIGASKIARDITERKRAEQKFRSLLESAPDAMMIHGAEGRIEIVNAQAEKLFGYTRDELIGQTMEILMPERFRRRHVEHRKKYAPTSVPRPMGVGMELLGLCKDGREIPVEISLSNLGRDGDEMVISSIRDISERRQAEEALRLSQRFAQSTLEAIPASLAVLDETGTIISTNESWSEFARQNGGLPDATGMGANYLAACDNARGEGADQAVRFAAGIREVLSGAVPRFSMEYPCHSPEEKRWFVGYVTPFKGDGPRRVVIAHLDISQRKRAEQVVRRLNEELESRVEHRTLQLQLVNEELMEQIAARHRLEEEILEVSEREQQRIGQDLHDDLGQRLAGAWMMSTVLERNLAAEASREAPAAASISELLKNAVAMTRSLARGLHPVAAEPGGLTVALRDLAARARDMFHVDCRLTCAATVHVEDNTTATHLYRIAQEAVSNAVKHGHARHVRINLSSDAETTVLTVKDDGCGIGPLDPNRHGMGLRIMRYRTDIIGGTINITHQKNGGTSVTCTLPTAPLLTPKEIENGKNNTRNTSKPRGTPQKKGARRR